VDGLKSAKEVWDTLFINHEGTKQVREGRIRALESELNRFVIKDDESPQDMYNHLNKIINKIKSLGSTRWGRREVVDKILSAYMARNVQLPTLIREKRGFNKFTLADVIGRMEDTSSPSRSPSFRKKCQRCMNNLRRTREWPSRHLARSKGQAHRLQRSWSRKIVMKIVT
jgi:hypothetical protein